MHERTVFDKRTLDRFSDILCTICGDQQTRQVLAASFLYCFLSFLLQLEFLPFFLAKKIEKTWSVCWHKTLVAWFVDESHGN
ncbi:unnamed protein product [Haemonchus placei]|uniref:Uncharacterized protein n=1 Tax=Haemonchus placei TaxID=6290 RepID=A0A158QLK9_HAEPC|nr:unnamed protein product [Haemonchus placei]